MKTQCSGEQLEFHALGRRSVAGRFDGGRLTSDAGGILLSEVDKRIGLTPRLARCFVDNRNRLSVEHDVHALVSQRIYAIALGYEDLNDHGALRGDALLSLLVGKRDLTGEKRKRESDRGYALASASTLNRLELGETEEAARHRYKRIVSRPEAHDELLVEVSMESQRGVPREVGWIWMRPTIRCMATRRGGSSMGTTAATVICRCTSSVENICYVRGCAPRTATVRRAASRNSSASWSSCAGAGPAPASISEAIRAFAVKRS